MRIQRERLRVVFAANFAMVHLYWDVGKLILDRQDDAGWGARIIDRLSRDLQSAHPDMKGFSPRNLLSMRSFAAAYPVRPLVKQLVSQLPIELMATPFNPSCVGQLNLYLSAVDDLLRHADDKPTIGLLLCQSRNKIVVEYALRNLKRPIGVAEWETKLVERLPDDLEGNLPSIEEIEAELGAGREAGK